MGRSSVHDASRFPDESCFTVRQVASSIGSKPRHRGTLRALGLGRIGQSRVLPDRPEIRGMLLSVAHLVEVIPVGIEESSR